MSQLSKFPSREYKTIYEYLHDYTGCSKKQKLMDDLSDFLYFEKLNWAYRSHRKFSPEVALITVSEPATGELLELGGSLPNDLFLDNWGTSWASFFQTPSSANGIHNTISLKDLGGTSRTFNVYNMNANNSTSFSGVSAVTVSVGTQIQIGSSTTAPARADVAIGTAFSTAPESTQFSTGSGSYTAGTGTITFSGSITAGNENGTINEALVVQEWVDSGNASRQIAILHDATTATAFSNAKSITVQYSISD